MPSRPSWGRRAHFVLRRPDRGTFVLTVRTHAATRANDPGLLLRR